MAYAAATVEAAARCNAGVLRGPGVDGSRGGRPAARAALNFVSKLNFIRLPEPGDDRGATGTVLLEGAAATRSLTLVRQSTTVCHAIESK